MLRNYKYASPLKPYIEGLISQKRSLGYNYEYEAYIFKAFDDYCIKKGLEETNITKKLLEDWFILRDTESKGYRAQRISFVRQLSLYMNSLGIDAYIPKDFSRREIHVPHILNDEEVISFFSAVDSYQPATSAKPFERLAVEYKVFFRLVYCCGLRNAEACNLTVKDVDLDKGILTIIHSKGNKDRLVYLAEDMKQLCREYLCYLHNTLDFEPEWFFPCRIPTMPMHKTSVDKKFNEFWTCTPFASNCDKKPTVHSLRHTFVVKRINLWMEKGLNLNIMMPYLSKHLGHKGRDETFYYYHQTESAFRIIHQKDNTSGIVIPEVNADE